ncbi:MAG TPA: hypothetical protein VIK00_05615 [Candidatus Limnocylindrales bacterium]|jgi:hypothetical protein
MSAPTAGVTGTPTFLFTDIQGSTPAAEREWDIGKQMSAEEAADYAIKDINADKAELSAG